jgi:hypothetical protein
MWHRPPAGRYLMAEARHRHESNRLPPADHTVLSEQKPVEIVGVIGGHCRHAAKFAVHSPSVHR